MIFFTLWQEPATLISHLGVRQRSTGLGYTYRQSTARLPSQRGGSCGCDADPSLFFFDSTRIFISLLSSTQPADAIGLSARLCWDLSLTSLPFC